MIRPRSIAEVPPWAWSDLNRLPELAHERERLIDDLRRGARSQRNLVRRRRLADLTRDILARETRLAAAGVDPKNFPAPVRHFSETEH